MNLYRLAGLGLCALLLLMTWCFAQAVVATFVLVCCGELPR